MKAITKRIEKLEAASSAAVFVVTWHRDVAQLCREYFEELREQYRLPPFASPDVITADEWSAVATRQQAGLNASVQAMWEALK